MFTVEAGLYEDPGEAEVEELLSEEGYDRNDQYTEAIPSPEETTHVVYDNEGEGAPLRASYVDSPDQEVHGEFDAMVSIDAYSGRTDEDVEEVKETAQRVATEFGGAFLDPQEGERVEADQLLE